MTHSYKCPRCKTALEIPKGRPGAICPKCKRTVLLEELQNRPKYTAFLLQMVLVSLLTVAVMGIVIFLFSPIKPQIPINSLVDRLYFATSGTDTISTNNYANTQLEYYYYIPQDVVENKDTAHPVLVMIPGLSGDGSAFVSSDFKRFADAEGFVIIAPSFIFDEENWAARQSYQYPDAWSGSALLKIINQVEQNYQIETSKLHLFGFSAGAQYALRFCLWLPDRCTAAAGHGSGGRILPNQYSDVKYLVTVGIMDTERIENAKNFYNYAQSVGLYVKYKEYNTDHSLTAAQVRDSMAFFKEAQ